jgi:DNA-binding response OmpR family regulator/DNA-binding CsgD family transcriptional regulator
MGDLPSERITVLVVDDSLDTVRMLNDVLEDAGMTALVALEGLQALTITGNITPDLILLDAIMPHMDGFETCRRLRQNPRLADVPILFMTGLSDTGHVLQGFAAGGVDYITKPINAQELVARMRVHLANARLTRSARIALDSAGQPLCAVDSQGVVLWATPQAHQLFTRRGPLDERQKQTLQEHLRAWIAHRPEPGHAMELSCLPEPLRVQFLSLIDGREHLLRLAPVSQQGDDTDRLKTQFGLTAREADVLLWIAKGKTNREIGLILEMSPRTVNKHLEQVFRKLGVENRTSAAACALKCMGGH